MVGVSEASGTILSPMLSFKTLFIGLILSALLMPAVLGQARPGTSADSVLMRTLQQELNRAMTSLGKADPVPYFMSYAANDEAADVIAASNGAIVASLRRRARSVDISVRVGTRELDNTHGENRARAVTAAALPVEDKDDAIARVLWLNTDRLYKRAAESYLEGKTKSKVRAEEEASSPVSPREKPAVYTATPPLPTARDEKASKQPIPPIRPV